MTPHGRVLEGPTWTFFWVAGRPAAHAAAGRRHPRLDHARAGCSRRATSRSAVHARRRPRGRGGLHRLDGARGHADRRGRRDRAAAAPGPSPGRTRRSARCAELRARGERLAARRRRQSSTRADARAAKPFARETVRCARTPNGRNAVLTVIGNRPQFIKAAAVSGPLRAVAGEVLVHTGQHYDEALSQVFFDELGLPRPEHRLDLGGGTQHRADRTDARRARAAARRRAPGARARLRRHELDAGRRARRRAGRDARRARRGRHALLRPHDAGGAQPRADRPRQRPAAVLVRGARRDPARRAGAGRGRGRRRRDGRRRAAARPARGGADRRRSRRSA